MAIYFQDLRLKPFTFLVRKLRDRLAGNFHQEIPKPGFPSIAAVGTGYQFGALFHVSLSAESGEFSTSDDNDERSDSSNA